MMYKTLLLSICLLVGPVAWAETKATGESPKVPDSSGSAAALEVRATQAFSAGEYEVALPLLKKVAVAVKDQPERLGAVEEMIRVSEKNLAKKAAQKKPTDDKPQPADAQAAVSERPVAALGVSPPPTAEQRKAHAAPKEGEISELPIKDLGNFAYDQENGGNIPADVKRLSGYTFRLRGYMIPMDQADSITQFAMVPDLFACCFGQPPQIQHTVIATCPPGKAVGYSPDELLVEGKLKVEEKKDDGYIISIFEVEVSSVKPAPK